MTPTSPREGGGSTPVRTDAVTPANAPRINPDQLQAAVEAVDRLGTWPLLSRLEQREPEVAEVVLEELTELHHELYHMGLSRPRLRRFGRRLRRLCCTVVLAMRPDVAA
jgi:hypothetical protein